MLRLVGGLLLYRIRLRWVHLTLHKLSGNHALCTRRLHHGDLSLESKCFVHGATDLFELGYIHLGKRENQDKKCHEERCHISKGSHPGRRTPFAFRALFLFVGLEIRFKIYPCQPIALPAHSSSTMTSILRFCDLPKAVVLSAIGRVSAKPAI